MERLVHNQEHDYYYLSIALTGGDMFINFQIKDEVDCRGHDDFIKKNVHDICKQYQGREASHQIIHAIQSEVANMMMNLIAMGTILIIPTVKIIEPVKPIGVERRDDHEKYVASIEHYRRLATECFGITNQDDAKWIANKLGKLYGKYGFWEPRLSYAVDGENPTAIYKLMGEYGYGADYSKPYQNPVTGNVIFIGFKHDLMENI